MKIRTPSLPCDADISLAPSQTKAPIRRLSAADVFADSEEIIIEHAGQAYRLRITRNGKLILTK